MIYFSLFAMENSEKRQQIDLGFGNHHYKDTEINHYRSRSNSQSDSQSRSRSKSPPYQSRKKRGSIDKKEIRKSNNFSSSSSRSNSSEKNYKKSYIKKPNYKKHKTNTVKLKKLLFNPISDEIADIDVSVY